MRFLLTAVGTNNNSTVAKYLKETPDNYVVGTDIYPAEYIPASFEIDKFYRVPSIYEMEDYKQSLLNICKKERIDFLFPVIDEEVYFLAQNKHLFEAAGTTVCCSSAESVGICRNKFKTFETVKENLPEIYTKTSCLADVDATKLSFPVFVKPSSGRASNGCKRINNKAELDLYMTDIDASEYIVQEYVEGEFFTVEFVNDIKHNKFVSLVRQELVRNKNGCGVVVKTVKNEYLEDVTNRLINLIGFYGAGNCEYIFDKGKYYLIEINPRMSAGTDYSMRSGLDIIENQIKIFSGQEIDIDKNLKYDKIYARRYETYELR